MDGSAAHSEGSVMQNQVEDAPYAPSDVIRGVTWAPEAEIFWPRGGRRAPGAATEPALGVNIRSARGENAGYRLNGKKASGVD